MQLIMSYKMPRSHERQKTQIVCYTCDAVVLEDANRVYDASDAPRGSHPRYQATHSLGSVFRYATSYCQVLPEISGHAATQYGSVARTFPRTTTRFGIVVRIFLPYHGTVRKCRPISSPVCFTTIRRQSVVQKFTAHHYKDTMPYQLHYCMYIVFPHLECSGECENGTAIVIANVASFLQYCDCSLHQKDQSRSKPEHTSGTCSTANAFACSDSSVLERFFFSPMLLMT